MKLGLRLPGQYPRMQRSALHTPGGLDYVDLVRHTFGNGLLAYWPLNDELGTLVSDYSGNKNNLVGSGALLNQIGIGDDCTSIWFDGINDNLSGTVNDFGGTEGAILIWLKQIDNANRHGIYILSDGSNYLRVFCSATKQMTQVITCSGGSYSYPHVSTIAYVGWSVYAITWSETLNKIEHIFNGAIVQSRIYTGAFKWTGLTTTVLVAIGSTTTPASFWLGNIAHVAIGNKYVPAKQLCALGPNALAGMRL